jgi:pimeloyl-ACP methyl ester carboxylesterase
MGRRGLVYRGESRGLDHDARSSAPGEFVKLSDGSVHYELSGSPTAQTVVLVPGFSVPYQIWDPTFRSLVDAGYRVLRYDLFGRGFSDRPDLRYDFDLFDRQLVELLETLEVTTPIDVVGLSLGGAISLVFAERHQESIKKLCLIDPAGLPWSQSLSARMAKAPILGELIMGLLGSRVLVNNLADYFFGDQGYAELKEDFLAQMEFVGFKKALLSTLRSGATTGAAEAYAAVGGLDVPVLLIWGKEDQVVPFELSETAMELIPRAESHAIENAAHIPHYECSETVNPILLDFLKR